MIFVSVGTHETPFDRLLQAISELKLDEELVVQHGLSAVRCDGAIEFDYLPFDRVLDYVREARAIVTHAGVGSVMLALANEKRPIVMARRHRFGEAVDDHQVELAARLEATGLVSVVEDSGDLVETLGRGARPPALDSAGPWLGVSLRAYLTTRLGEPLGTRNGR